MKKTVKYFALAVVALMLGTSVAQSDKKADEATVIRYLDVFNELYKELHTFYVDTLDGKKTIENAIVAMLNEIDPYTEYIPAANQEDFFVISTGEYGGIGSYVTERKGGGVCISGPYEGSPAARAGLKCGDHILVVDGDTVAKKNSTEVTKKLKGMANTPISVTVKRPYAKGDSVLTFNFLREKIHIQPVPYYGVVRGSIGYISLSTYNEHSAEQVKAAILNLQKNPEVKQLVLDLRGNTGGLVDEAIKIVGFFVPKGTQVLEQKARTTAGYKVYKTTEQPIAPKIPLAVLVDGGSASASEITAGALQDLDRAVIIGSRSYGKGLVQTTRPLPYDNMLKVTIAKYYIPSGRLIQELDYSHRNADGTAKVKPDSLCNVFLTAHGREVRDGGGIKPDIEVKFPKLNRLIYNLIRDEWVFDYANKFAAEHDTIASPRDFVITDEIFADFKSSIDESRFNYDKVCEEGINSLRSVAETEGYMTDSVKAQFDLLEQMLKHNLEQDLNHNRKEIARYLSNEIIKRYYYDAGEVEHETVDDECLDRAAQMWATDGEYEKMLNLGAEGKQPAANSARQKSKKGK